MSKRSVNFDLNGIVFDKFDVRKEKSVIWTLEWPIYFRRKSRLLTRNQYKALKLFSFLDLDRLQLRPFSFLFKKCLTLKARIIQVLHFSVSSILVSLVLLLIVFIVWTRANNKPLLNKCSFEERLLHVPFTETAAFKWLTWHWSTNSFAWLNFSPRIV
jgi:hypothetical protein